MKVSIQKYDPSVDERPYVVDYEVDWHENMTVLEAITAINDGQEPVVFDFSCRGRDCGRCSVSLNGKPCLACVTLVSEEGENLVAPLPNFPVVRDLIVDKTKVTDRVAATMRRQRAKALTAEDLAVPVDPELYAKMDPLEHCSRCCVCTANCPVVAEKGLKKFAGPTQLIAIALRHYDPYDQGDRVIEAVQAGLFECIQCGACDEVCKALEIDHLGTWADLRAAAEERGLA